jgi:hypothetical protein
MGFPLKIVLDVRLLYAKRPFQANENECLMVSLEDTWA